MIRTLATLACLVAPALVEAQGLAARVDAAPPGHVQFRFAARPGVCGNGRSWIQTAPGSYTGTFNSNDGFRSEACEPGPVRVLVDRAERQVIAVQTYVGPAGEATPGVTDLGQVAAQDAADFLLGLAAKAEGRVGRDAIWAAMLADSAQTVEPLIAIARNQALPRETRTRALQYAGRGGDRTPTISARTVDALLAVARDEADNLEVRRQAVRTLGALPHGAGIPRLIELAGQQGSTWLAKEGMSALASSGDPRARDYLRAAVKREDLGEEAMAVAVRALGQNYATPQVAALLRSVYPRLKSDRTRDAAFTAIAEVGGADNVRWLLDMARNENEPTGRRRKALEQAVRAGAPTAELVRLYDAVSDQGIKESLVGVYGRSGERAALDKLIAIVGSETNVNVRRRAITALSSSDDPKAKQALQDIVVR
jgi:HEAT repeat protein